MKKCKVTAIVQARMGSTRLPGKVLLDVNGNTLMAILLSRLSKAETIDEIILATSTNKNNDPLVQHVQALGYGVYRGHEEDVLERFYQGAKTHRSEVIVRITGDCPLIDPAVVDEVVTRFAQTESDYVSNIEPPTFPDGLDVEVFSFSALEQAHQEASTSYDREHVTPYLRREPHFRRDRILYARDLSSERWTVDDPEDFQVISNILNNFSPDLHFTMAEVLALKKEKPALFAANQNIERNEGAAVSKGQKLWRRAKRVIPGGNMLLSKRAEMFLPEHWPAYYSKASGCTVWDLEGNSYIDASIMGIGTNILGYGHPQVDEAVRNVVANGNMSTFNCPEEVLLAERLVALHPWAEMVRFARTGGEANAISIRIARAAAGKSKVAFCGYHGWHDWYLAANLGNDQNLDEHLLEGLAPKGVPRGLKDSVLPFNFNDYTALKQLVEEHDIGVIKMEVQRSQPPQPGFLEKVRSLADRHNIVLIFDECTSGFRQTFGGIHKVYGVEPDLAIFGKAIGNGYALTAVIGRRAVMEAAQSTFISSTFWTERIGPAAALKTLEIMEETSSWETITATGKSCKQRWLALGRAHGLKVTVDGLDALAGFQIQQIDWKSAKTYITQEMLKRGYLAADGIYVCTEHTTAVMEGYFEQLDEIFGELADQVKAGNDLAALLDGPVCHSKFQRLN